VRALREGFKKGRKNLPVCLSVMHERPCPTWLRLACVGRDLEGLCHDGGTWHFPPTRTTTHRNTSSHPRPQPTRAKRKCYCVPRTPRPKQGRRKPGGALAPA
jgi:hypothetical protein